MEFGDTAQRKGKVGTVVRNIGLGFLVPFLFRLSEWAGLEGQGRMESSGL